MFRNGFLQVDILEGALTMRWIDDIQKELERFQLSENPYLDRFQWRLDVAQRRSVLLKRLILIYIHICHFNKL